MKDKQLKVVVVEPMKEAYVEVVENKLEALQKLVGGYIEVVPFTNEAVVGVCNEEGKINGLPLNRALYNNNDEIRDIVAGTMFIVGDDYINGEFKSLTDEQVEKYLNQFLRPEVFYRINDEIVAVKVEENFWEV